MNDDGSSSTIWWIVGILALLLLIMLAVWLSRRAKAQRAERDRLDRADHDRPATVTHEQTYDGDGSAPYPSGSSGQTSSAGNTFGSGAGAVGAGAAGVGAAGAAAFAGRDDDAKGRDTKGSGDDATNDETTTPVADQASPGDSDVSGSSAPASAWTDDVPVTSDRPASDEAGTQPTGASDPDSAFFGTDDDVRPLDGRADDAPEGASAADDAVYEDDSATYDESTSDDTTSDAGTSYDSNTSYDSPTSYDDSTAITDAVPIQEADSGPDFDRDRQPGHIATPTHDPAADTQRGWDESEGLADHDKSTHAVTEGEGRSDDLSAHAAPSWQSESDGLGGPRAGESNAPSADRGWDASEGLDGQHHQGNHEGDGVEHRPGADHTVTGEGLGGSHHSFDDALPAAGDGDQLGAAPADADLDRGGLEEDPRDFGTDDTWAAPSPGHDDGLTHQPSADPSVPAADTGTGSAAGTGTGTGASDSGAGTTAAAGAAGAAGAGVAAAAAGSRASRGSMPSAQQPYDEQLGASGDQWRAASGDPAQHADARGTDDPHGDTWGAEGAASRTTTGGHGTDTTAAAGTPGAGTDASTPQKLNELRQKVQGDVKDRWTRPGQDGQSPSDKFGQLRERVEGEVRTRMQNRQGDTGAPGQAGGPASGSAPNAGTPSAGSPTGQQPPTSSTHGPTSDSTSGGLRGRVEGEVRDRVQDGIRRFRNRGGQGGGTGTPGGSGQ